MEPGLRRHKMTIDIAFQVLTVIVERKARCQRIPKERSACEERFAIVHTVTFYSNSKMTKCR